MTAKPCDEFCPFKDCGSCPFQGGATPVTEGNSARMGAAPEGASTPFRGLAQPKPLSLTEGRTAMVLTCTAPTTGTPEKGMVR